MKHLLCGLLILLSIGRIHADNSRLTIMQQEIKHIVIVMMENRSFDNLAAWLYDDKRPPAKFIPECAYPHYLGLTEESLDQYTNDLKNSKGEVIYSSPPIKGIPSTAHTPFINSPKFDPNEPFPNVQIQIFGDPPSPEPAMLGFLQDFASLWPESQWVNMKDEICAVMETYTEKELPIFLSLARHYAISDYWFSSVPTQTNPNRAFTFCGTSQGQTVNGALGKSLFTAPTIWNRFHELAPDVKWSIFWQADMLPEIYCWPYSGKNQFAALANIPDVDDHFMKIDKFHELATAGQLPDISFLEPQWTAGYNFFPKDEEMLCSLYPDHDWILGTQGNDMHPPGDVRPAENFLMNIYTSLIANPEAWAQTLLVVTFDEHGGLFDHVPPPAAIPPDENCQDGFAFDRYGVRIPTLLISPKINQAVVLRSDDPFLPFDHTSLTATLLKWKNIDKGKWNLGQRAESAPTFEAVIECGTARTDPVVGGKPAEEEIDAKNIVNMDDLFYLKDSEGNYLCHEEIRYLHGYLPYLQTTQMVLTFGGGSGSVMHGSFVLIKPMHEPLGDDHLLTAYDDSTCSFVANLHNSNQWWTVKSVDHPHLGSRIQNGDRVYLENHVYYDLWQYVPCRLTQKGALSFGDLRTEAIVQSGSDQLYWTIEKL